MTEKYKWPFPKSPFPYWWKCTSSLTIATVSTLSKLWICYANSTKFHGLNTVRNAITMRSKSTSLITAGNHHSCMDDPILCAALPWKLIFTPSKFRWTPSAHDICFYTPAIGKFFALGKSIPIVRGDGVNQRGMDYALEKMDKGEWVHLFPEGRVNVEKTWIRLKWGIGRLIRDCEHCPIVIPYYHVGMDTLLPTKRPFIPRIGKKLTVVFGDPIEFEEKLRKWRKDKLDPIMIQKNITDIIQSHLDGLKPIAYDLHESRS